MLFYLFFLFLRMGQLCEFLPCWCSSPSWQSCTAPPTSPSQCSPCHCPPATVGNKMNWLVGSISVYLYGIDISKEGLSCLEKEWMEYCKNLLILKRIEVIMTNIILAPCQSSMQRMMWWHCWLLWQKRSGLDQGDPGGQKCKFVQYCLKTGSVVRYPSWDRKRLYFQDYCLKKPWTWSLTRKLQHRRPSCCTCIEHS